MRLSSAEELRCRLGFGAQYTSARAVFRTTPAGITILDFSLRLQYNGRRFGIPLPRLLTYLADDQPQRPGYAGECVSEVVAPTRARRRSLMEEVWESGDPTMLPVGSLLPLSLILSFLTKYK